MNAKSNEAPAARPQPSRAALRTLQSRELLAEAQEVIIEHQGEFYRLRCTSKGKLILTK
jgi:hemin uptake protein HemP